MSDRDGIEYHWPTDSPFWNARLWDDPISEAWGTLRQRLRRDHGLAWAVHCNLAVPFMDEGGSHEAANRAAARIMWTVFDFDSEQLPQWKAFPWASRATTDTKEGDDE